MHCPTLLLYDQQPPGWRVLHSYTNYLPTVGPLVHGLGFQTNSARGNETQTLLAAATFRINHLRQISFSI